MTKIRELREERGLKSIEVAYSTRIHPTQLSSIEVGKLAASTRARETISSFFGVRESELFGENGIAV